MNVANEIDDLVQYLRRDCIEISGVQAIEETSCIELVKAVGQDLNLEIEDDDISTAHPLPTFNKTADSKIIVKFTRKVIKDEFYSNRKLVAGRKASSLKNLKG